MSNSLCVEKCETGWVVYRERHSVERKVWAFTTFDEVIAFLKKELV